MTEYIYLFLTQLFKYQENTIVFLRFYNMKTYHYTVIIKRPFS